MVWREAVYNDTHFDSDRVTDYRTGEFCVSDVFACCAVLYGLLQLRYDHENALVFMNSCAITARTCAQFSFSSIHCPSNLPSLFLCLTPSHQLHQVLPARLPRIQTLLLPVRRRRAACLERRQAQARYLQVSGQVHGARAAGGGGDALLRQLQAAPGAHQEDGHLGGAGRVDSAFEEISPHHR